jgi:hypothetical protein
VGCDHEVGTHLCLERRRLDGGLRELLLGAVAHAVQALVGGPQRAQLLARRGELTYAMNEKVANRDIRVWHGTTENGP